MSDKDTMTYQEAVTVIRNHFNALFDSFDSSPMGRKYAKQAKMAIQTLESQTRLMKEEEEEEVNNNDLIQLTLTCNGENVTQIQNICNTEEECLELLRRFREAYPKLAVLSRMYQGD